MKFSVVLALVLMGSNITASAQKLEKPKGKSVHSKEKESKSTGRAIKEPANRNSASQELRRIEQSSAKGAGSKQMVSGKAAHTKPLLKAKKEVNPPIRFGSGGSAGKGAKGSKAADPYKGRLKQKGNRK